MARTAASAPSRRAPHWERQRNAQLFDALKVLTFGSALLLAFAKLVI